MTDLDPATAAAADFYDQHYACCKPLFLEPGMRCTLGSPDRPKHCRFCGLSEPEVQFKTDAHALPAAFGRIGLFSNYECDACNSYFGKGIENDLGNWTKPMRTLMRIKGRSGVPTIQEPGGGKGWRVEYSTGAFQLSEYEGDPHFTIDEQAKQLRFELHRDPYIPVAALKGLVKIGLTLLPEVELAHFSETFDWIRNPDHSQSFVAEFPIIRTFISGPMPNDKVTLMLLRRRSGVTTVPYAFYVIGLGNEVLQVFIPSLSQDQCINGQPLSLVPFPTPGSFDAKAYGRPRVNTIDLTGRETVRGEKVPATFGFDGIVQPEADSNAGGAGQ